MTFKLTVIVFLCASLLLGAEDIFKGDRFAEEDWTGKPKSTLKAIGLSLLLPGAGEIYLGAQGDGIPFIIADGIIWTLAAGFGIYGSWRSSEYRSYAQRYAGVDVEGKDSEFFRLVALWDSRDTYNQYLLLTQRDRSILLSDSDNWQWRDEEHQLEFYDIWTSSEHSWQRFKLCVAAAGLNRLVSALNVLRLSRRGTAGWNITVRAYPAGNDGIGANITLMHKF